MSTQQIPRPSQSRQRRHSIQRDYSLQKLEKTRFKIKRKIGQLENKVCFFEGQLNPLAIQNKALKDKLVQFTKLISSTTDLLRNLLPIENNPTRKLKIQLANLQEVSFMIREDWLIMKSDIKQMTEDLYLKGQQILTLQQKHQQTVKSYENVIAELKKKFQQQQSALLNDNFKLKKTIQDNQLKAEEERQKLILSFQQKLEMSKKMEKDFQKYVRETNQKFSIQQKLIQRLRDEISSNAIQFEKNRQTLKQIYENLMQSKLDQQTKQFQFLLKQKEDERIKIMEQMISQQEELKKKLTQKNYEINYLSGLNDKLKQQIGSVKNQIWAHKLQLDKYCKQLSDVKSKLTSQEQKSRILKQDLQATLNKINATQEILKATIQKYEKTINQEKIKNQAMLQMLKAEKQTYLKTLKQSESKINQYKRKLRQYDDKYSQIIQSQKRKFQQLNDKFQSQKLSLQKKLEEKNQQLKNKQALILQIKQNHEKQISKIQLAHTNKLKNMQNQYMKRIQFISNENKQTLSKFKKQYEQKIASIQQEHNQYIKKLVSDQNIRLYQFQQKYKRLEQQSLLKIKQIQNQLTEQTAQNRKLKQECQQIAEKLVRNTEQYKKMMQEQRKESEKRLAEEKQKILNQMQQQILSFKRAMQEKQADYKNQLNKIQDSLQKQINMLKQNNAIEEVEEKYKHMICQMKQQMDNEMKRMISQKDKLFAQALVQYHKDLQLISQKLEFDISKLNEKLLSERETHQFYLLSREQKIQYLLSKINSYRNQMNEKDNQIIQLQFQINKKNNELSKVDQIVAEKVRKKKMQFQKMLLEIKAQCDLTVQKNQSECQAKIKKIQTDRIAFTQSIYDQFQQLKLRFNSQMNTLLAKYEQLERIFEERPSRAEDVSKIKHLIEQKQKMDLQIKQCKKKVKEANEIVKYLNLQLQNYKETYDIFGPGGEPLSPEKKSQVQIQSPIKSIINLRKESSTSRISEEGERFSPYSLYSKDRKILTEGSQIVTQFKLFPSIHRNNSQAVAVQEQEGQSETSSMKQEQKVYKPKRKQQMFRNKTLEEDKSQQLKSNASIFMSLLNNQQKLPVQIKKANNAYGRRNSTSKRNLQIQKKFQIKQKTLILEQ